MRSLVVYESSFGHTEAIARALAAGIAESGYAAVFDAGTAPVELWGRYDLVLVGGPTQVFSMSRPSTRQDATAHGGLPSHHDQGLREWLDRLGPVQHHVAAAAFDTRQTQARHLPGSAARAAQHRLHRLEFDRAAAPTSFYVTGRTGPLLDGEVERAVALGRRLGVETATRVTVA